MKFFSTIGSAALLASAVSAAPVALEKRAALTDADILQFALFLEHLENVFYKQGIATIPYDSFIAAGYSPEFYNNLLYVAHDEEQHVELLTSALSAAGATPNVACEYSFPFADPYSFVALASVLEGVGTAAYLGAAPAITEPAYLSAAGSILVTEAVHHSLIRFNLGQIAPGNPYGSALGPNEVYTMAASFVVSCPASNTAVLPFTAFPALTAAQGLPTSPLSFFTFTTTAAIPAGAFLTFVSGATTISVPATINGQYVTAQIPETVEGQSYALLTSVSTTAVSDDQVIAGPTAIEVTSNAPTIDFSVL